MAKPPTTDDIQAWNARRIRELEAELAGYRDGSVQAWSRRRIGELEAENQHLRDALAGPFSVAGRRRTTAARIQALIEDGKGRPRKSLSDRTRWEVMERDGHRCVYCGVGADEAVLQIDHMMPVADGGTDDHDNLVTACKACNEGKGDRATVGY